MRKKNYILELKTLEKYIGIKYDNQPADVRKVQEWINLWKYVDSDWNITVLIDGDFGKVTLAAVKEFQKFNSLTKDGIIGNNTWRQLTEPMRKAYSRIEGITELGPLIVAYAKQHLNQAPHEFKQNEGTWVRAYMDGYEGKQWPWCVGFVQTVIDQATYTLGQDIKTYMPLTYSCDVLGNYGRRNDKLIVNAELRTNPNYIEPGDVFLNLKNPGDWTHTGLVISRDGDWINTIEGNTNDEGSREGYEVCRRKRNFMTKNIDLFKIR